MMNDRFSVELRQHLLASANERPADGQVAAIVERVAVTRQRGAGVRLPWLPGRVGPFASPAVRYGLIAAALIIAIVGAALAAGIGPVQRTVFDGTWTSIDPADGSTMTLDVGGGTSPAVRFVDDVATGAACVADEVKVFKMDGSGTIVDDHLDVVWPDGGGCGLMKVEVGPGSYTYDKATDTITDGQELTWTRVRTEAPQTRGPVTEPSSSPEATPLPSPTTDSNCIQFDAPGTYTAPVDWMSLTVNVPGTAAEPWIGDRDAFSLMQAACIDRQGTGWIDISVVTHVDKDACAGVSLAVETAEDAIAAVSAAKGIDVIERTDVTVDGYTGTRFDFSIPDVANACHDQQIALVDGVNPFDPGVSYRLYLIDIEGKPLAVALYGYTSWDPAVIGKVDAIVASMRIAPTSDGTPAPPPSPHPGEGNPECIDYRDGGTYAQSVDPLTVTATLPAGTENGWWGGSPDVFAVGSDTCLFSAAIEVEVSMPWQLFGDACRWRDTAVDVRSRAEAHAILSQNGLKSTPSTDVTLGGYPATRFEISVPEGFDLTRCDVGDLRLWDSRSGRDAHIDPDQTVRFYLVDVAGLTLGVTATYSPGDERLPAHMAELDAILASLRIEPQ